MGGFRGGGGGGGGLPFSLPSGIRLTHQPKGPPFAIILRHPFSADQPENFCKSAFGANLNNFEGEPSPKNAFFVKAFQKGPTSNVFFGMFFFQKFACGAEI